MKSLKVQLWIFSEDELRYTIYDSETRKQLNEQGKRKINKRTLPNDQWPAIKDKRED